MDPFWLGFLLGFLPSVLFVVAVGYARAGNLPQLWWGLTVAGRANQDGNLQGKINTLLVNPSTPVSSSVPLPVSAPVSPPPPPPAAAKSSPPAPPKPTAEPLRLLTLLQTESRIVDFLMEDIGGASDAQIGQGVREIHKKASATLKKVLEFQPIITGGDGERVTVEKGFDPSAVRVLGNVTGEPPYTGSLQHPGWRVKEMKLPNVADGQDPYVIQPAEVEV